MTAGWFSLTGRLSIGIVALCIPFAVAAQGVDQSKAKPPTPAPQPAAAPPTWMVACTNSQAGLDCRAAQSLLLRQAGRNIRVSAALLIAPETKKPNLLLQLPLGVSLPSGVTLQIGSGGAKALPFQSCSQNGCIAEYAIVDAEISTMLTGADLTLSVQTADKTPFTFKLPSAGFAAAYAKMKSK